MRVQRPPLSEHALRSWNSPLVSSYRPVCCRSIGIPKCTRLGKPRDRRQNLRSRYDCSMTCWLRSQQQMGQSIRLMSEREVPLASASRLDMNQAHHAPVFMFQQVAMIGERSDGIRVAEIHAQLHTRVLRSLAVPVSDIDGVSQERFVERNAVPLHEHEMQLMNVERVQFLRPVLDDPVLDIALAHHDVGGLGIRVEYLWLPAIDGNVEVGMT